MKHEFTQRVYYADTDAYGVTWHGTYLRWMEMARVEFCDKLGLNLVKLKEEDNIVFTITELSLRYKSSSMINDNILIETFVSKITPIKTEFTQIIKNKDTGAICVTALVEIVAITNEGKIYRRIPEFIMSKFSEVAECND